MIFVTVGTQLGFDRLISTVDNWAAQSGVDVFAQIGGGVYIPKNIKYSRFLDVADYQQFIENASLIVSHAGMGSLITARLASKPILMMPRIASLGEHRNDHQISSCRRFSNLEGCFIAKSEDELSDYLSNFNELKSSEKPSPINDFSERLAEKILGLLR